MCQVQRCLGYLISSFIVTWNERTVNETIFSQPGFVNYVIESKAQKHCFQKEIFRNKSRCETQCSSGRLTKIILFVAHISKRPKDPGGYLLG
jgi:hypothetical protein